MSSLTSDVDYGSDDADRRKLVDGESNGDDQRTKMITKTRRIDRRPYQH